MAKLSKVDRTSGQGKKGTRLSVRKKGVRRLVLPFVALVQAAHIFFYTEPPKPRPKSRGKRQMGDGTWIEIVDYNDPVTGRGLYSIEYGGEDGTDLPRTAEWLDANGKVYSRETYGYDSSGRKIRITERDRTGKLLRVTTYAYHQDGTYTVTVTDYSTSPATITVYK
jgi:hypothetical protein